MIKLLFKGIKSTLFIITLITSSTLVCANDLDFKSVTINGSSKVMPHGSLLKNGHLLLPIRWLSEEMGATCVKWQGKEHTLSLEVPFYFQSHQYLSYLSGIEASQKKTEFPLPDRLRTLVLPKYPLKSLNAPELQEKPIKIDIQDRGFSIPFVAYDYAFVNDTLYVGSEWFNTLFLANTQQKENNLIINYPTETAIQAELDKYEALTLPQSKEEALSLWIHGQQSRSGALQYSTLSPELKAQVLQKREGWVTGGSSPSAGKANLQSEKALPDQSVEYTLTIDEMLQGKIYNTITQIITIKPYHLSGTTYWFISEATGDLDYYSILGA